VDIPKQLGRKALPMELPTETPVDVALSPDSLPNDDGGVVTTTGDRVGRDWATRANPDVGQHWGHLVDNLALAVVELDLAGRVTYANPFLLRLTGYEREDVIGVDWLEQFISGDEQAEVRDVRIGALRGDFASHVNQIVTRDGDCRRIAWFNTVTHDPAGRMTGTLSVGHDITDQEELAVLEERDRIAYELDKETVSHLSSSLMRLSSMVSMALDPDITEGLWEIIEELEESIKTVRTALFGKHGHG
jgi:PAS domain S-box-containing protein